MDGGGWAVGGRGSFWVLGVVGGGGDVGGVVGLGGASGSRGSGVPKRPRYATEPGPQLRAGGGSTKCERSVSLGNFGLMVSLGLPWHRRQTGFFKSWTSLEHR